MNKYSKALLGELCSDSRINVLSLSDKLQSSRYKITKGVEELEKQLGLYYTVELDYKKLGFNAIHITYLKFVKKPSAAVLEGVVGKINAITLAILTQGDFDLVCFVVTKTPIEYSQVEIALQLLLQEFGASVRSNEVTLMRHGFVPLTNSLIERSDMGAACKAMLAALNANSRARLSKVSKSTGISENLLRYRLTDMERKGIIKRYTAIVTKPNTRFTIAYFVNYSVRENLQARIETERRNIIFQTDERSNVNDFQMMFSTTGSEQTFNLATYADKEYGMEHSITMHNRIYAVDKPEVTSAVVKKTIKGMLPFRYMEVKENYNSTNWPTEFA